MGLTITKTNLVGSINMLMSVATNPQNTPKQRSAALNKVEGYCHEREFCRTCHAVLAESQHVNELLALLGSRQFEVRVAGFKVCNTMTRTTDRGLKRAVGKRLLEDLVEILLDVCNLDPIIQELLVSVLANLLTEDPCRNEVERSEKKGTGGIPEFISLLNYPIPRVQLASLRALTALSERPSGRQAIIKQGVLPIIGLCFVTTLWGQIRCSALRLLANLSKESEVRDIIGPQGVMFRLAHAIRTEAPNPVVVQLVASVYSNFSQQEQLISSIDPKTAVTMLYSLVFSPRVDIVIQGLWSLANCVRDATMRLEFIETDGMKLVLAVLQQAMAEPLVWHEVARVIATISSGGQGSVSGTDEEKEYLIREGSIEALKTIYEWCSKANNPVPKDDPSRVGPEEPEEAIATYEHLYNAEGEDVAYSARYVTMTMCTEGLRHLSTYGYVCQLICEIDCVSHVMHVLRADYDTEGQLYATAVVANLALHAESCKAVVQHDAVGSLVDLLLHSTHEMVHLEACAAMANIGKMSTHNLRLIVEAGGPAALIKVLKPDNCPVETAIHAIRALGLLESNEAKYEVMNSGGLPLAIRYAKCDSLELKKVCSVAFRNLAELNDDSHQLVMAKDGALVSLVSLLKETDMEVLRNTTKAITILTSRMESNKIAFLEQDGHHEIVRHLTTTDDDLLIQVLSVLGNLGGLADINNGLGASDTIVRQLCYVLQMDRFALTLQAMRCLAAASQNLSNAKMVLTLVPSTMLIEMAMSPSAALQRHALSVLSNLALVPENRIALRESGIMQTLETLFASESFELVLMTVHCIGHMLLDPAEADYEMHDNLTALLVEIAAKASAMATKEAKGVRSFVASRNLSMLQAALTTLKIYSQTARGVTMLVQKFNSLQLFFDCLENHSLNVRKDASGSLANITTEPVSREIFISEGGTDRVVQTLRSAAGLSTDVEKDLMEICAKIKVDTRLKNGMVESGSHSEISKIGLSYEEREVLMNQMDGFIKMRNQNSLLQASCLDIIFNIAHTEENQKMLLTAYDWNVFMQPFDVPTVECQTSAAKTCFKMLQCSTALHNFIDLKGVSKLLRALELEDPVAKQLAAHGLGQLSNTDPHAFRRAILDEGGVGMIMGLTGSTHHNMRAQAFSAVAQLCTNKELGEVFVAQNVLQSVQIFSTRCRYEVTTYLSLVQAVGNLTNNEAIRWKVLEKGGASLLFRSLTHPHLSVIKCAASIFTRLLSPEIDVREGLARCKMSPAIVECINMVYDQEVLHDVLRTLAYMSEREAYAEKVGTPALIETLFMLTDDKEREREISERKETSEAKLRSAIAEGRIDPQEEPSIPEVVKPNKGLSDGVAAAALLCAKNLLALPNLMTHVIGSKTILQRIVRSAVEKSALERINLSVAVTQRVLTRSSVHKDLVEEGLLVKLSFLTKVQHTETRLAVAECYKTLSDGLAETFTGSKICKGIRTLLSSTVREVQECCCIILINILKAGLFEIASYSIMSELLLYVEADCEPLQIKALEVVRLLCVVFMKWFESPILKEKELACTQCEPAVPKVMSAYRRSLQRSRLAIHALHTLSSLLACCPNFMCKLIDGIMVLDLKRAATQKVLPSLTPPPRLVHGRAALDVADYVKKGKCFPWDLCDAPVTVQAARALCFMSSAGHTTGMTCMVNVLKTLTVEDMIKTAYNTYTEGGDIRTVVLLMRTAANCVVRGTQKYQLADDKTGLLKLAFLLCSHASPYVVHPAIFTLARAAEEPAGHNRMLAMASFEVLARICKDYLLALKETDTVVNGMIKKLDTGPTLLISEVVIDVCRLMSNLSDGGNAATRSLKEADSLLRDLYLLIPKQLPLDARVHVSAVLCTLDVSPPDSILGISASFADFIDASRDRIDNNRVLKGVIGLCTLCRDPLNHQELVQEGGISALCTALRNPVPTVFKAACWGLCYMSMGGCRDTYDPVSRDKTAKERAKQADVRLSNIVAIHKLILEEGIGPAVKMALGSKQTDCQKVACKLISILLRTPETSKHLVQNGFGRVLTTYYCPSF